MGVSSLPKTVTRQRHDCDLKPGLLRLSPARYWCVLLGYRATLYYDEHVCFCVCLSVSLSVREYISGITRPVFVSLVRVTYCRDSDVH